MEYSVGNMVDVKKTTRISILSAALPSGGNKARREQTNPPTAYTARKVRGGTPM
jgi:hypothetical protein